MAAHVRKDRVHGKPSAEFVDTERSGYWTAYYGALELESSFEDNVVFAGQPSETYLRLTKRIDLGCQQQSVNGLSICTDVGADLEWNCRFALGDRDVSDTFIVTGLDSTGAAEGTGVLGYEVVVNQNVAIGLPIQFQIVPLNPDLVFADIKHCQVKQNREDENGVSIIGSPGDSAKDKCTVDAIHSGLGVHSSKLFKEHHIFTEMLTLVLANVYQH